MPKAVFCVGGGGGGTRLHSDHQADVHHGDVGEESLVNGGDNTVMIDRSGSIFGYSQ